MRTKIQKSFVSLVVILAVVLGGLAFGQEKVAAAWATDSKTGISYYTSADKTGWEVDSFKVPAGFSGKLVIPATYKGIPVVEIGAFAIDGITTLTSVTIPSSVKKIGAYALYNNINLTSISIPASVVSIGDGAFQDCINLKSVTLKDGLQTIGDYAFYKCTNLKSILFPETLKAIGEAAFNKSGLTSVVIPGTVQLVSYSAFNNCANLSLAILGEGITTIDSYAFYNCPKLSSLGLPGTLKTIGKYAFDYAEALTQVTIPSRVTTIGSGAFSDTNLNTITFNGKVSAIGEYAFYIGSSSGFRTIKVNVPLGTTAYYNSLLHSNSIVSSYSTTLVVAEQFNADGLVAKSASYTSVKLTWAPAAGATGYEVSRSTSATGPFATIANVAGTSYTNSGLKTGTKYYYRVRAYNGTTVKNYSLPSAVVMASPVPAIPATFKAARASSSSIKLTWKKVTGATGYEVRDSAGKLIKSTTSVSVTKTGLKKGTKYSYKVRAYKTVSGKKVYGPYSAIKTATP